MFFQKYKIIFLIGIGSFLFSFIVDQFLPPRYSVRGVIPIIEKEIKSNDKDFKNFCRSPLISNLLNDSLNEKAFNEFLNKKYFIFIYDINNTKPILWNTQTVSPDTNIIYSDKNNYLTKLPNGWYVVKKEGITTDNNKQFVVLALIPVKYEYYVNNDYLKNSFSAINGIEDRFFITQKETPFVIKNSDGLPLFYLGLKTITYSSFNNNTSIWLRLLSILILFFLINQYAIGLIEKTGLKFAWLFLLIIVSFLRFVSYLFPFPFNLKQFELFSPLIYGSNFILSSLGDLFVNVFLIEWMILFIKDNIMKIKIIWPADLKWRIALTTLLCLAMMGVTILCGFILNSLVSDSQISFDVLNFFSLNIYSVIGFLILCGIATVYFFTMQLLLHLIKPVLKENIYLATIIIIVSSLLVLFFLTGNSHFVFYFLLLIWLLLFLCILNFKNLSTFKTRIISSKLIFWIFFFSVSITLVIVSENNRKELESRKHYLEKIADKTDPSSEKMMSITLSDLNGEHLPEIFGRFSNKAQNYFLKDSLLHENFPGFLNRYETKIYTFDSTGEPLFNQDSTSLNTLNAVVETQSHPTSVPDLSFYDISFERFNYITRKTIKTLNGQLRGYLFIISSPKRYKSNELYPQLFNKGNSDAIENSPLYSYAIYSNGYIINSYNDYPFPTRLPREIKFYSNFYERNINGYSELWYKVNLSKLVVITKPDNIYIEAITLFAYLFCFFLAGMTIVNLFVVLIRNRFNFWKITTNIHLTVRNQVHGTIMLISIISFLIIGVTTILFFIKRYNKNDHEKLSRTINVIENDILNFNDSTFQFSSGEKNNNLSAIEDKLQAKINHIADIHGSNINVYDLYGNLRLSSLPLPYNKGILSNLMDPSAYFHLKKIKDVQFFRFQKIGDLQYLNNYIPLRKSNGIEYGYLNIPYFESQNKLYEEISNFLVTIINLNAFIFLIAGILAFFITNRITDSFFFISQKMKEVNLGKTNELIEWKRKDEIGELVKEYNRMVMKLDESAQNLAKNEREGAWREMARQVAHEIKNPLTPMKLNLQYLQMAIENKSPKVMEISLNVTKILVEQIDHLSQIASNFSQFSNINHSNNQRFDLNKILKKLHLLYAANSNLKIDLQLSNDHTYIFADKTQVQRLFTNLIQNAVQSIPENKQALIQIYSNIIDDIVLTSVKDNGNGIPETMREKIFTPNFTTKSSGTGLGLAMCKGIVEKISGKIWFETTENNGTTFFVEIPLDEI